MNLEEITAELNRMRIRDAAHHAALQMLYAGAPAGLSASLRGLADSYLELSLVTTIPDESRNLFRDTLFSIAPERAH